MKVAVLGATGDLGAELVRRALVRGDHVVAFVRRPDALEARPGLSVTPGQLADTAAMAAAFSGADAVVSTVGGRSAGGFMQAALPSIGAAVQQAAVPRFVLTSAFGVGDSRTKASSLARLIYATAVRSMFEDKARAEAAVLPSLTSDWTVAYLVNLKKGSSQGQAEVPSLDDVAKVPGLPTLPFVDAADALLDLAATPGRPRRVLVTTRGGWRPVHGPTAAGGQP